MKWVVSETRYRFAQSLQPTLQQLRILREADAQVFVAAFVVGWGEGGAGGRADTGFFHQFAGEGEAVLHAFDLQEAVERAFGAHPADAVLRVDEVLRDFTTFAAALQQTLAELVAFGR